ncbi:hypothetical protein NQ315_007005 [Exocentrus adspersus]|uniref:N-acetyltransferase domain-containing protein n=1 Tax=Exocentrus adspersus TaxID=1586481 RepID=A0AAV8WCF3_9CUCU|nr:hypothetical protein NQ315_007005 [Exocentrus adspersus]
MAEEDILVDIPDENLPELAEMYKKHQDWAPHVYSTIMTGLEWRKKKNEKYMIFMSPNGCWKEDGIFFLLLAYNAFDIFYFTLGDGENICEAFRRSKILQPKGCNTSRESLYCIHQKLYTPVREVIIKEMGKTLMAEHPSHMFSISSDEALKFQIQCPEEVYIKHLDTTHADFVNSLWLGRYENAEKLLSLLIEMNGGYGLFLKSNDQLVSWVLLSMMGQLTILQTLDGYKRKGYASVLVKYISVELAKKGYNAFGAVFAENVASVAMFEKLGFKYLGIAVYLFYK